MANNFFMGWTGVYGLEAINSPDALVNPWLHELVVRSGTTPGITWDFWVAPEILPKVRPFFDAINVRYYFDRGHDRAPLRRSLKLIKSLDLDVWESSSAWPRAFFTDRIHVYDTADQFMDKIKTGDGRPFAAVQRSDAAALRGLSALEGNLADRTISAATQYLLGENTTEFTIHANGPGVAVLSETFWPGDFRCEINGRKAPVLRLNHAFKGAAIDAAGDYQIVFRYLPKNFPRNLLLSAIGTTVFGLSLWLALRPPRAASSRKLHDEAGDSRERSLF